MGTFPPWKRARQELLLEGWRRCEGLIEGYSRREATQHPGGGQSPVRTRGHQCKCLVSPVEVEERGMCACSKHVDQLKGLAIVKEMVRTRLRAKYDLGPLPLEDE